MLQARIFKKQGNIMTRRLILVDFYWTRDKDPRVPLGHASLYTTLVQRTDVEVMRLAAPVNAMKEDTEGIINAILDYIGNLSYADIDIAVGAYVWAEEIIQALLPALRRHGFAGRIILGGPQITYMGQGLEGIYPDADIFVRGYGEDALCKLVQTGEPLKLSGVHVAGETDLRAQADIDLAALPSPWLSAVIPLEDQQFIRWETQRGCRFRCAFCQHCEAGQRLTHRALDDIRIFQEIDLFCESAVQEIAVLDPIFNTRHNAVEVLERFVERQFVGRLSLQCRAELVTDAFLNAAEQLDVCLEFGLQTIHDEEQHAIRRNNVMEKVEETLLKVRQHGIDFEVSLIFGLPAQTLNSFKESVDWCLKRQIPVIKAFPLMLLRGTALERQRDEWGLVEDGTAMPKVIASNTFTKSEWAEMAQLSQALRLTEGQHPRSIDALMQIAQHQKIGKERWQPK